MARRRVIMPLSKSEIDLDVLDTQVKLSRVISELNADDGEKDVAQQYLFEELRTVEGTLNKYNYTC